MNDFIKNINSFENRGGATKTMVVIVADVLSRRFPREVVS